MKRKRVTDTEVHMRELDALAKALGPLNFVRFMQIYAPGSGDYTIERHKWLDKIFMDDIAQKLREKERSRSNYFLFTPLPHAPEFPQPSACDLDAASQFQLQSQDSR